MARKILKIGAIFVSCLMGTVGLAQAQGGAGGGAGGTGGVGPLPVQVPAPERLQRPHANIRQDINTISRLAVQLAVTLPQLLFKTELSDYWVLIKLVQLSFFVLLFSIQRCS